LYFQTVGTLFTTDRERTVIVPRLHASNASRCNIRDQVLNLLTSYTDRNDNSTKATK